MNLQYQVCKLMKVGKQSHLTILFNCFISQKVSPKPISRSFFESGGGFFTSSLSLFALYSFIYFRYFSLFFSRHLRLLSLYLALWHAWLWQTLGKLTTTFSNCLGTLMITPQYLQVVVTPYHFKYLRMRGNSSVSPSHLFKSLQHCLNSYQVFIFLFPLIIKKLRAAQRIIMLPTKKIKATNT